MKKRISILVPTIGERKNGLRRLLDSLIRQDYDNLEVIIIGQDHQTTIQKVCDPYSDKIDIILVPTEQKGLSKARNIGLDTATGDIVLLSDDDCWYKDNALKTINHFFEDNPDTDILLTQIYDPIENISYKEYPKEYIKIKRVTSLLSKSSIEIAFRRERLALKFDELFGLGGKYIAGEENDFLIRAFRNKKNIEYMPIVTVYHRKKIRRETKYQLIAKGALYSKNFGYMISNLVLLRDLIIKHQNNYKWFWHGYFNYKKQDQRVH